MRIPVVVGLLLSCLALRAFGGDAPVALPAGLRHVQEMSPQVRADLFWFFCSSRAWRVSDFAGAIVAEPRDRGSCVPDNLSQDKSLRCSARVRFSPYTRGGPAWLKTGDFTHANTTNETIVVAVTGDHPRDKPHLYSSRLLLSLGNDLWIEITEMSAQKGRHATESTLKLLDTIFSSVVNGRRVVEQQLHDDGSMITRVTTAGLSQVQDVVVKKVGPAAYEMCGYVNLGEPGFIQVATDGAQAGSPDDAKMERTIEWPGWSENPQTAFFFAVPITVDGDGSEKQVCLRLEFSPRDKRVLMTTNIVVTTWTR